MSESKHGSEDPPLIIVVAAVLPRPGHQSNIAVGVKAAAGDLQQMKLVFTPGAKLTRAEKRKGLGRKVCLGLAGGTGEAVAAQKRNRQDLDEQQKIGEEKDAMVC